MTYFYYFVRSIGQLRGEIGTRIDFTRHRAGSKGELQNRLGGTHTLVDNHPCTQHSVAKKCSINHQCPLLHRTQFLAAPNGSEIRSAIECYGRRCAVGVAADLRADRRISNKQKLSERSVSAGYHYTLLQLEQGLLPFYQRHTHNGFIISEGPHSQDPIGVFR